MIDANTELRLREARALLEHALRDSLQSDGAATLLVPALHDFATASLALTPDLSSNALVGRVFRLILHVARTRSSQDAGNAHPALERLVALGKVCAEALRTSGAPGARPECTPAHRAPNDLTAPQPADTRAAAQAVREKARALVRDAMRTQMRSAALLAASSAGFRVAEGLQAELRSSVSGFVRALRRLGEPAESVITEVRVLTLECAAELCGSGPDPACAWAEPLHDQVVQLAIEAYCDASAA